MKRMLVVILLWLPLLPSAMLEAADLSDVIRALEAPFQAETDPRQRIADYEADFSQVSLIASLDRLQKAYGRVVVAFDYQHPDPVPLVRFHWQYEQPAAQQIVSNGRTLWVYLPENRQVIQSDLEMVSQAGQNDPMAFLTGLGNLSRDFTISWAEPNQDAAGHYVLELTPIKSSALISRLVLVVHHQAVETVPSAADGRDQTQQTPAPPRFLDQPEVSGQSNHENGANGVWFPILSTTVYDPNGNSTHIEFNDIVINRGVSPSVFDFEIPAGVQVVKPTGQDMGY